MPRNVTKILIAFVVVFVVIQFIRPAKNIASATSDQEITHLYPTSDSVQLILQKACYDCHSNNTRYPWYFHIQPVAWWMTDHINGAKGKLNFSEFGSLPADKQIKKLKGTIKEVQKGGMPLNSYTWIHKDAILTDNEKNLLIDWAGGIVQHLTTQPVK